MNPFCEGSDESLGTSNAVMGLSHQEIEGRICPLPFLQIPYFDLPEHEELKLDWVHVLSQGC